MSEVTPSSSEQSGEPNSAVSLPENDQDERSSLSVQEDTSIGADTSTAPDYQGFTQEQWNELQRQKEEFGYLSTEERGRAMFNGEIDCPDFAHLWFEHQIDGHLINHVGVDEFYSFLKEIGSTSDQCNIYCFAEYFSITFDEFVSLMETNPHVYDLETAKRRYKYFNGSSQEETRVEYNTYYCGLSQEQWQRLQDQKEMYENLTEKEKETLFDGYIVGHGDVDCRNFIHLYWEHLISIELIRYVGGGEFNTWTIDRERAGQCIDIYSLAERFSIELDELVSLIEKNGLTHIYDLDTVKRHYEYFYSY